jgi:tetratricopeptide (TPR) repeat protein
LPAVVALAGIGFAAVWLLSGALAPQATLALPELDVATMPPHLARAYDRARNSVLRAPDSGDAWGELGMLLLAYQFEQETAHCLTQAAKLDNQDFRWPYFLGVHLAVSHPDVAVQHFQKATQLRPDAGIVQLRYGEVLLQLERYEQAAGPLRRAVELDPHQPRAYLALAKLALAVGETGAALPWAERAVQIAPESRAAYESLALVHQRLGNRDAALQALGKAEQLSDEPLGWDDPFAAEVLALRHDAQDAIQAAEALLTQNRIDDAIATLTTALRNDSRDPTLFCRLAKIYLQMGEPQQAIDVLHAAQVQHPHSPEIFFHLGVVQYSTNQFEDAIASFQSAVQCKSDYALAHYNLGHAFKRLDRPEDAITAFRNAVRDRPSYVPAHINLARLLWSQGRRDEARSYLRSAFNLEPNNAECQQLQQEFDRQP